MKLNTLSAIALLFVGLLYAGFGYANEAKQCHADANSAYQALMSTQKSKPLNINTASQADFVSLVGVGHKTAQAIVDYRHEHGKFDSVQSLMNVKGIGPAILNKNRHRLSVAN
ncbi:ComEA family DNA-binding protein [Moraxella catarrhalis]|uniref:ComEA family DNA-binding protein n=1 Tax=Moraxella catarrhalis TaxID=480 RepID=UPI0007E2F383|nr:ComEA family DNA-binding protein [Moraxella catarrhalis]OAV24258.1 DNA uptake protein and related DNA-binding protein [Moraxella catarrhalis]